MSNKKKLKKYAVRYQKTTIMVPYPRNPRKGTCQGCGRKKGKEIKTTQLHHTHYAYETKTVKKNPLLALENILEVCYNPCHKAADAFRMLTAEISIKNHDKIITIGKFLPEWQRRRFTKICELWLKEMKK